MIAILQLGMRINPDSINYIWNFEIILIINYIYNLLYLYYFTIQYQ